MCLADSTLLAWEIETLLLADTTLMLNKVNEEEEGEKRKANLCGGRREEKEVKEEKERESTERNRYLAIDTGRKKVTASGIYGTSPLWLDVSLEQFEEMPIIAQN